MAGGQPSSGGTLATAELYDPGIVGIPCEDLVSFQARCNPTGGGGHKLQARLILTNTSHSGEQVTITVDGHPKRVTINGNKAQLSINGVLGGHIIVLTDPAGCFPEHVVGCR